MGGHSHFIAHDFTHIGSGLSQVFVHGEPQLLYTWPPTHGCPVIGLTDGLPPTANGLPPPMPSSTTGSPGSTTSPGAGLPPFGGRPSMIMGSHLFSSVLIAIPGGHATTAVPVPTQPLFFSVVPGGQTTSPSAMGGFGMSTPSITTGAVMVAPVTGTTGSGGRGVPSAMGSSGHSQHLSPTWRRGLPSQHRSFVSPCSSQ